jgi:predicted dienelactone hydrolase
VLSLRILFASMAFILLSATGQAAEAPATAASQAEDFAKPGPLPVGFQQFPLPDKDGKRPLLLTVWYPAVPESPMASSVTRPGSASAVRATKNAAPVAGGGSYPLVIIAHGLMGSGSVHFLWGTHLASYGFVVMAADARDFGDASLDAHTNTEADAIVLLHDHPADVSREIAYADTLTAPGGQLAALIDTAHIGVWGYTAGGTTALQAAGARIDFQALAAWCNDKRSDYFAQESCQFVGHESAVAARYGVTDPMAAPLPSIWDRRVAALVLAAPGGQLHAFDGAGLTGVAAPTLVMAGTGDMSVSASYNSLWAYGQIGSPTKALAIFDGGTQRMFRSCCGYDASKGGPTFRDLKAHLATAFLLDALKRDPAAHQALLPGAFAVPGVEYKTTMQ